MVTILQLKGTWLKVTGAAWYFYIPSVISAQKKKIDQYFTISESNFCNEEKICFSDWNLEGAAICRGK